MSSVEVVLQVPSGLHLGAGNQCVNQTLRLALRFAACALSAAAALRVAGKNANVIGRNDLTPYEALFASVWAKGAAIWRATAGRKGVVGCGKSAGCWENADMVVWNCFTPDIALQASIWPKVACSANAGSTE